MPTPESLARENIDFQLTTCGWVVQSRSEMNLYAARGVAVREFPFETGEADYLFFLDRKAVGVAEAKPEGVTLLVVGEVPYGDDTPFGDDVESAVEMGLARSARLRQAVLRSAACPAHEVVRD